MFYYDWTILLLIPALIISAIAQARVSSTYNQYLRVPAKNGYTGLEVAKSMLNAKGLHNISVEHIQGNLTDHYDPRTGVLRLSDSVYNGTSIAAVSVAAHEVGHAIQHAEGYAALNMRNVLAPIVSVTSNFVWILILAGLFLSSQSLLNMGILVFVGAVVFQLITLPVEFNASSRAIANLQDGYIQADETPAAKKVLSAAAMTYVAATIMSVAQLLRLLTLFRRRD